MFVLFIVKARSKDKTVNCRVCNKNFGGVISWDGRCDDENDMGEVSTCPKNYKSCRKSVNGQSIVTTANYI